LVLASLARESARTKGKRDRLEKSARSPFSNLTIVLHWRYDMHLTMTAAPPVLSLLRKPPSSLRNSIETMSTTDETISGDNNNNNNSPPKFSSELLRMYYARLFPFELLYNWMTYDPSCAADPTKLSPLFCKREFSFTLDVSGEEVYLRYKCFKTMQELKQDIQNKGPRKIDIGAVFDHYPKDHKSIQITPQQRELVFDIDLTDYDGIRKCGCSGADICSKCWEFMSMAVKVMEEGLREDFGFEHVAWFYSGRRGVHAWVCDESARLLSNDARSAVATYFEVSV
jgi:hypothetical protein